MELYLIRHAESENNAKPPYERIEDPSITPVGRLQAERLADWVQSLPIGFLITSPFKRALQTTNAILRVAPQTVHVWHDVFERGGVFRGHGPDAREGGPGMGRSEILRYLEANDIVIDQSIAESGWWQSKPRETDEQCQQRAKSLADRLIADLGASSRAVVVVTHADFKRHFLTEVVGDAIRMERIGLLRNTGVTKLVYEPVACAWKVDYLNSVTHLPPKLITGRES